MYLTLRLYWSTIIIFIIPASTSLFRLFLILGALILKYSFINEFDNLLYSTPFTKIESLSIGYALIISVISSMVLLSP